MSQVFSAFVALGPPPHSFFLSIPERGWNGASVKGDQLQTLMDRLQMSNGAKIYCLAFGQDGSHSVTFKEPDPDRTNRFQNLGISNFYPTLNTWVQSLGQKWKAQELYVALGPCGSWWAWSNLGQSSHKIPSDLEERLKRYDPDEENTPRVCLGRGKSWILWDEKGSWAYSLKDYHGADEWLNENLRGKNGRKIVAASLSIFEDGVYFVLLNNGQAHWKVTDPYLNKKVEAFVERWKRQQRGFIAGEVAGR